MGKPPVSEGNEIELAISALAQRQHGHVTRAQLIGLGFGAGAIAYRIRVRRLIPVRAGVYAVGHIPTTPVARAGGAVLACGSGAALSHGSAATLWGIAKRWTFPLEVTVAAKRRPRNIRVHCSPALTRKDIRWHLGIRVTSPARTLLDIAPRLSEKSLTRAANDALLSRHLREGDLADILARFPRHPGARRLRRFVHAPTGPTRSELEDVFAAFVERFGLPRPEINVRVGRYEVDALFRAQRVIVELDGLAYHGNRDAFERDRERDAEMLVQDLETVRITWERLTRQAEKEAARLDAILRARGG
jgi:hypothetical protein